MLKRSFCIHPEGDYRVVMKEYKKDLFNRRTRRRKPRRRASRAFIFFLLCCCLTVFAIGLAANHFPFATGQLPGARISAGAVSGAGETASGADAKEMIEGGGPSADEGERSGTDEGTWRLILVNRWNRIPDDYEVELTKLTNGQSVDQRIYPALQDMFDAARNDGVYPAVVSGYRTGEKQQHLLDEKIAAYRAEGHSARKATAEAEAWVATPGTSEHQLGIAVDINADEVSSTGDEVYEWLNQNSYQFGFIRRYPADKTEITGVIGEPWHYRYVGVDAATEIYTQGICLEEYLGTGEG
jgi:D-alanyl-D-alanine carboxypeptidase